MAELDANVTTETAETNGAETHTEETDYSAELAKLRADFAKQKAALDKATKEAGDAKKALRAKQTAEEAAAEEAAEKAKAQAEELAALRKEIAVNKAAKKVMAFVGNEETATEIAGFLYGSEDADAVIDAFSKAWTAKEKALRLEYGKIPAPGAGGGDGPSVTREQLDGMSVIERTRFAREHPDEYNKMMGR